MLASAVIVDLSAVKACWEALRLRSFRFSLSWILSSTLATCGKTEICLKSLFIFIGLSTLGTGLTRACLLLVGYLDCTILAQIINNVVLSNSSAKKVETIQHGIFWGLIFGPAIFWG